MNSSIRKTLCLSLEGVYFDMSARSLASSAPVWVAPSISRTSMERPAATSVQEGQPSQGSAVIPFAQLSPLAKMRATVVLPTPRMPEKM